MKLVVVHPECGREVLVQQILESQGHCPWDGKPFSRHYTAVLAEALGAAEVAGSALQDALDRVAQMEPNLRLEEDSLLGPVRPLLDRLNTPREVPSP